MLMCYGRLTIEATWVTRATARLGDLDGQSRNASVADGLTRRGGPTGIVPRVLSEKNDEHVGGLCQ